VNAQRALVLSLSLSLSDCTHVEALYYNEQPQAMKALQRNLDANFGRSGFILRSTLKAATYSQLHGYNFTHRPLFLPRGKPQCRNR